MFKFLFLILVMMSSTVFSQESGVPEVTSESNKSNSVTQKIDEFGPLADCDRGARLDAFAVLLNNDRNAKGYIIFYQGENDLPVNIENSERTGTLYLTYLTQVRGLSPEKIVLINSYRKETATELWIVPQNAAPPTPTAAIEKPKVPTDKTLLYDIGWIEYDYYPENTLDLFLPAKKAEREEFFKSSEETEESTEEIIPVSNNDEPTLSAEELEDLKFSWTSDRFGAFLEKNKKMQGVIMFYADDQELDINKVTNHIEDGKRRIAEKAKIAPERIQVKFGGYKQYHIHLEFWAVPEKGNFPEPKPDERIVEDETEIGDR